MVENGNSEYVPSIFVGAATGLLKTVELGKRQAANYYGPDELDKTHEIETENEKNTWKGLYHHENALIGVNAEGEVKSWKLDDIEKAETVNQEQFDLGNPNFVAESEQLTEMGAFIVTTGPAENPVKCSAQRGNHLAVGGDETQLQVYDMNVGQKGCLFKPKKAKSPPPDKLQLHIPLHFPACALPTSAETILASAYGSRINQSHEVRLYDPRATQRRPVKRIQWERHPITSICSIDPEGHKVACGNARGKMMWVDFRQEKRIHPLKGPAGSVRQIALHPDQPGYVAAVGLDRHLYLFDTKTNARKQKIYLKSQLNTVVIEPGAAIEKEAEEKKKKDENEDDDEEEEEVNDEEAESIWKELDAKK